MFDQCGLSCYNKIHFCYSDTTQEKKTQFQNKLNTKVCKKKKVQTFIYKTIPIKKSLIKSHPKDKVVNSDPKVSQEKVLEMKHFHYDDTVCRVFKRGVQNLKDFCLRINIPIGNY